MPMNLHGFRGKIVRNIVARKNEETNDWREQMNEQFFEWLNAHDSRMKWLNDWMVDDL